MNNKNDKNQFPGFLSETGECVQLTPACNTLKGAEVLSHLVSALELLDEEIDDHDRGLIEKKLIEIRKKLTPSSLS